MILKRFSLFFIFCTAIFMQNSTCKAKKEKKSTPYTVMAIVKAKKGKELELENELKKVVEPSRNEKTCLEYKLHKDLNNPEKFILYENWTSKEDHQLQFQKPYIIELLKVFNDLIAEAPQFFFAQEI